MKNFINSIQNEIQKESEEIIDRIVEEAIVEIMPKVEGKINQRLVDIAARYSIKVETMSPKDNPSEIVFKFIIQKKGEDK